MRRSLGKSYTEFYNECHWKSPSIRGINVKAYWWNDIINFGDLLTPVLLEFYGFNPIFATPEMSEVISSGSILHWIPEDYSGFIIGSGMMKNYPRRFPNAKILSVRGELTKHLLGLPESTLAADPGILANRLLCSRKEKKTVLGIVPHFSEKNDTRINSFARLHKKEVRIIDVKRHPKKVINEIDQCEFILSSSLHGLIVADSLDIRSQFITLLNGRSDKLFKFSDYFSSYGETVMPLIFKGDEQISELLKSMRSVPEGVSEKKERLEKQFRNLHNIFD